MDAKPRKPRKSKAKPTAAKAVTKHVEDGINAVATLINIGTVIAKMFQKKGKKPNGKKA